MTDFSLDFNYLLSELSFPTLGNVIMIILSGVLMYQSVYHKQKPLLLLPMSVVMLAVNLPLPNVTARVINEMTSFLFEGAISGVYPLLIFFAVGTMIDLGLLLASPKNFFIGASSQLGIFLVFFVAGYFSNILGLNLELSSVAAIIGSADGAMAMYLSALISPQNFAAVSIAAYSFTALLPVIQPKITAMLTTENERKISMEYLKHVSRGEKIIFAIISMTLSGIFLPNSFPLVGALMFGNILREANIIDSFSSNFQKAFTNIVTMAIGITIGSSAYASSFLTMETLFIFIFGLISFILSTGIGVITAKIMNVITGGKVNPIIGSAGISAFPVPSWSAHLFAQEVKSSNCLLLHAMAVNTAGIISGAIGVGIFLTFF